MGVAVGHEAQGTETEDVRGTGKKENKILPWAITTNRGSFIRERVETGTKHGNAYTAIITEAEAMASRGAGKGTWEELGVEMMQTWFSCMNFSVLKPAMHM